jgi:alanine racemase
MTSSDAAQRWAWADIDLEAIAHNVRTLAGLVAPSSLLAVVKADGYGHGAVEVGRAALAAGAAGLGVALVQEGVELRSAGIESDIVLLSQQPPEQASTIVENALLPVVYTVEGVRAIAAVAPPGYSVQLKIDTGMHRVGVAPADATTVADAIRDAGLDLAGVFTHLAIADEPDDPFTAAQLAEFESVLAALRAAGHRPMTVHAANSAGLLAHPGARHDLVRAGIALYGLEPGPSIATHTHGLRPALALRSRVSHVKRIAAGERISYGLRYTFGDEANVATVPIGYADGVPRRLASTGGQVLIGGHRLSIAGVVTMDQITVDAGDVPIEVGDEVVLIGRQGTEEIRAEEWARRLDTIGYEVVCGISARVPRRYGGAAL